MYPIPSAAEIAAATPIEGIGPNGEVLAHGIINPQAQELRITFLTAADATGSEIALSIDRVQVMLLPAIGRHEYFPRARVETSGNGYTSSTLIENDSEDQPLKLEAQLELVRRLVLSGILHAGNLVIQEMNGEDSVRWISAFSPEI